jgi:serine/threonine protein kinase
VKLLCSRPFVTTDIYGLGATLLTLLTGKEPQELRVEDIPLEKDIPLRLQELLARMMNPDPQWRPLGINAVRMLLHNKDLVEEELLPQHRWIMKVMPWAKGLLVWRMYSSCLDVVSKSIFFVNLYVLIPFMLFVLMAFIIGPGLYSLWLSRHSDPLKGKSFWEKLALNLYSFWTMQAGNPVNRQASSATPATLLGGGLASLYLSIVVALLLAPCTIALYLGILLLRHIPLSAQKYAALENRSSIQAGPITY